MFYETSTLKDRLNKAVEAERQRWIQRLREQRWLSTAVCRAITETLLAPEPESKPPPAMIREAVAAESRRNRAAVVTAILAIQARCEPGPPKWCDFDKCVEAIPGPSSKPTPPEPMTVERLIKQWQGQVLHAGWDAWWEHAEEDVNLLVQDQARRDAKVCSELSEGVTRKTESLGEHECRLKGYAEAHNAILKEAGLE